MKKILIFLFTCFIFSCSSIEKISNIDESKEEIKIFISEIKKNLAKNNFDYIDKHTEKTFTNKIYLNNIKDIDFSKFNIFISEPQFKEKISSIMALNLFEKTFYFNINFKKKDNVWIISEIEERR